jgi:hypothetical protein
MYSGSRFPLVGLTFYLIGGAAIGLALFWVVRVGARYGLRDHDTWRESRSPNPPSELPQLGPTAEGVARTLQRRVRQFPPWRGIWRIAEEVSCRGGIHDPRREVVSPATAGITATQSRGELYRPRNSSSRHSIAMTVPTATSSSRARSSTRRILPEMVFGSSMNSMRRMRWNGASCSRA